MGLGVDQIVHLKFDETEGLTAFSSSNYSGTDATIQFDSTDPDGYSNYNWYTGVFNNCLEMGTIGFNPDGSPPNSNISPWLDLDRSKFDPFMAGANSMGMWIRTGQQVKLFFDSISDFDDDGFGNIINVMGHFNDLDVDTNGFLKYSESTVNNLANTVDVIEVTGTTRVDDGQWHHLAYTKPATNDPSDVKLYIDGVLDVVTYDAGPFNEGELIVSPVDGFARILWSSVGQVGHQDSNDHYDTVPEDHFLIEDHDEPFGIVTTHGVSIDDYRYWRRELTQADITEVINYPFYSTNITQLSSVDLQLAITIRFLTALSNLSSVIANPDSKVSMETDVSQASIIEALLVPIKQMAMQIDSDALVNNPELIIRATLSNPGDGFGIRTKSQLDLAIKVLAGLPVQHPIQVIEALFGRE